MYVTDKNRTFVKAYHDVLKSPDLNPTDKLVYLTLLSYQEAGLQVFPSNEHVADSLSVSKDSVIRATSKLVKLGAIEKTRRFNKSNLITVHSLEVADCNVQRSQNATSRGSKVQLYKNTDNNKNKISKEEEGQNQDASLSQVNMGLEETRIHCDKSVSDLNLDEEIAEAKSVKREELVTQTYASMPLAQEDDEPLDHDDDYSGDSFTASQDDDDDLPYNDEEEEPIQNIFSTGNRIKMAPHQVKRQNQFNRNNPA
ncbi:helix-turn-helix domain-containing protein [Pantoea sp. SGAir0175]